jgi:diguanylate cyclase (GGDEF)-like protein/PAS domain S-box-containing protein
VTPWVPLIAASTVTETRTPACETAAAPGWRQRLLQAHFRDYTPAAMRMWLAIALAGALALIAALVAMVSPSAPDRLHTMVALLFVVVAAWFPVQIPRTKYSIGAADVFVFLMLSVLGPPAAVLAVGLEGGIGAWRGSKRWSSRISTPAAAMASMAVCGLLFEALWPLVAAWGLKAATAKLIVLLPLAFVPFVLPTFSLMATVTLKKGHWPDLRQWFSSFSWLAGIYLAAALVAGIVQLNASQHGLVTVGAVALAALGVVALLRVSIAHHEAEHSAQETRVSQARREAEQNQLRFAAAFTHAAIGMAIVDARGRIVRVNQAFCALLRHDESALAGQRFVEMLRPRDVALFERQSRDVTERRGSTTDAVELRCTAFDGGELWVTLHCGRYQDPDSAEDGLIYQVQDITSRQLAEAQLQHVAYHDSLTELPNRAYFHAQLAKAVDASRNEPGTRFAVMFLDLDRFKVVNDSLGHFYGNELLREVGRRIQQCLRSKEVVARLGGDEFAVLLHDVHDSDDGMVLAERILHALSQPLPIGGTEIIPSASVGVTFSGLGHRSVDELLRDADLAMYEAKAAGRGRVAVFDRTMHERIADKLALEADLRHAIGEGELSLSYQPLFDLEPYRLIGFEALARWQHPTRGAVSPAVFIALAEEAGHIEALTAWVIEKAVEQLAAWHRAAPHMAHLGISVNISARDLSQPHFVERVLLVLHRHGVASGRLTLEITETVLMSRLDMVFDAIARLRAAGVRLAIDDFGTGYSSLAYLGTLPVDCLKIDRSFVVAMDVGAEYVEIVRAVLTLGQALGKNVVAEGIETAAQLATLRRLGVHAGQGYLLSRPLRPEQVPALLYAPAAMPA